MEAVLSLMHMHLWMPASGSSIRRMAGLVQLGAWDWMRPQESMYCFLDSNDIWGPRYLAQFEPFLVRRLDMVQVGTQTFTVEIGDGLDLYATVKPLDGEGGMAYLQRCFHNNTLPSYGPCYYLYRRRFLMEYHLRFPDRLAVNGNLDINLRCLSLAQSVSQIKDTPNTFTDSTVSAPSTLHPSNAS